MDAQACVYNISWDVLREAKHLYNATHFLGGTAVTAPPFYDVAGRMNVLFWHSIPTRSTLDLEDNPLVMSLADFTENDFVEKNTRPTFSTAKIGLSSHLPSPRKQK
jgi:hypothetical protein